VTRDDVNNNNNNNNNISKNIIPNYVNINTTKTRPAANYTKISVQKTYLLNYDTKRDL
jgi:hypothetical protein